MLQLLFVTFFDLTKLVCDRRDERQTCQYVKIVMKISWILNIFFWIVVLFVVAIVWNRMHKSHVCFEKLWYDVVRPRVSQYVPVSDIPEYDNKKGLVHYES